MLMIIVLVFQVLAIILIGSFAKTDDSASFGSVSGNLVNSMFTLLFGFTLMYCPFRKLSIFSLVSLLITISVTTQTTILFATFWDNCFNGFYTNFQITAALLSRSGYACLAVLLTVLDFIGLFSFWQVYLLIAPIMTVGYCLISSIMIYGLKTFDGGGGLTVFLYSGICSLMIWILCLRGKIDNSKYQIKQSYINKTLGFIGVVITFINWPKFNMAGSIITFINVNKTITTTLIRLPTLTELQNSALGNTLLGLCTSILLSLLFASKQTKEQKLKYQVYIDCFINGGIVIASYQDIALNPVVCLILAALSTVFTLIVHRYFITQSETSAESVFKRFMTHYSKVVYRIVLSILGIIITSIVVASRNGQTPELLFYNYSRIAGFQIVALIITIIFSVIFGLCAGASINVFLAFKKKQIQAINENKDEQEVKIIGQISDETFFQEYHHDELFPIYYDIFQGVNQKEEQKINIADYTTKVIKESLLGAEQNPLRAMTLHKNVQTKAHPKDMKSSVSKDFNRSNLRSEDVSKMKMKYAHLQKIENLDNESMQSNKQEQIVINPHKELRIQKSQIKISEHEQVPYLDDKNINRRLQYDQGSEIKAEDISKSKVKL